MFVLYRVLARYAGGWIPVMAIYGLALLILPAVVLYGCVAYYRKKDALRVFNTALICLIAFDLYSFGWQKIGGLQMVVPLGMLDLPFNQLDGETLTWAYFRRSYPFTVTIALTQISGSLMLLFRRTRLSGLVVLTPVLVNIILIDFFYHLHTWVLIHALVLMSAVSYLLYQYRQDLVDIFLRIAPDTIPWRIGWPGKLAVICIPAILLATYHFPDEHPAFTGKYRVDGLRVNGIPQKVTSTTDSILTTVYMDLNDEWVMDFNHYNNRHIGTYDYKDGSIKVQWRYPAEFDLQMEGTFAPAPEQNGFRFNGVLGKDSLQMLLIRVPEPE